MSGILNYLSRIAITGIIAGIIGASNSARAETAPAVLSNVACDDSLKTRFAPDSQTKVLLVKFFRRGEPLVLGQDKSGKMRTAGADLCLVKLNVGPGNPGPEDAPSTSRGIGIEIWLPAPALWNGRIHVQGGGGWAGGGQGSLNRIEDQGIAGGSADIAAMEGAVSATTDTGHSYRKESSANLAGGDGSFAMLPDGGPNVVLWHDFAERSIHEMAVKTKALVRVFYGNAARYSYWDGFSTGGRQGLKEAQVNPRDFDGILVGAPAINWTRFITSELNPQVVMQRDLGGRLLSPAQLSLVSNAAINACDTVGGVHLGYIVDPWVCRYDPVKDPAVLCPDAGGKGPADTCVTPREARAINKIWYGLTSDGSVPDPATDNGFNTFPAGRQRWFALARGTELAALAGAQPFPIATDLVALELGDGSVSTANFVNAHGGGRDGWKELDYADLNKAFDNGVSRQEEFSRINTDRADLYAFRDNGGKMLMYHGLSDVLIPAQGSINYYNRVLHEMGGLEAVQSFYRLYLIPGMSHAFANGTANPQAVLPLPDHDELYRRLTQWVEQGDAPGRYDIAAKSDRKRTAALCVYPLRPVLTGNDAKSAESYACR